MRYLLKVDGTRTDYPAPLNVRAINKLIGAEIADVVRLRKAADGSVMAMIVDDAGVANCRAFNQAATALYHEVTQGRGTIYGDVFVCPDRDFA